jgi:hypothetical protein
MQQLVFGFPYPASARRLVPVVVVVRVHGRSPFPPPLPGRCP